MLEVGRRPEVKGTSTIWHQHPVSGFHRGGEKGAVIVPRGIRRSSSIFRRGNRRLSATRRRSLSACLAAGNLLLVTPARDGQGQALSPQSASLLFWLPPFVLSWLALRSR